MSLTALRRTLNKWDYAIILVAVLFVGLSISNANWPPEEWSFQRTDFSQMILTVKTIEPMTTGQHQTLSIIVDPQVTVSDVDHFEAHVLHLIVECGNYSKEITIINLTSVDVQSQLVWNFGMNLDTEDSPLAPIIILLELDYHLRFNNGSYRSFWAGCYFQGMLYNESTILPIGGFASMVSGLAVAFSIATFRKKGAPKPIQLFVVVFLLAVSTIGWRFLLLRGIWFPYWLFQAWPPISCAALAIVLLALAPFVPIQKEQTLKRLVLFVILTIIIATLLAAYGLLLVSTVWYIGDQLEFGNVILTSAVRMLMVVMDSITPVVILVGLALFLLFTLYSGITSVLRIRDPPDDRNGRIMVLVNAFLFLIAEVISVALSYPPFINVLLFVIWNASSAYNGLLEESGNSFIKGILTSWYKDLSKSYDDSGEVTFTVKDDTVQSVVAGVSMLMLAFWLYSCGILVLGNNPNLILTVGRGVWYVSIVIMAIEHGLLNTAGWIGISLGVGIILSRVSKDSINQRLSRIRARLGR